MFNPSLVNSRFKLFKRDSKWYKGVHYSDTLPLNIFFCKSLQNFYLSMWHIDLINKYTKWKLKKSGVMAFPTPAVYPITKKPTEVRMGKGKGGITDWSIPIKLGTVPFFFQGKKTILAKSVMSDLQKKLPIKTKISESKHVYRQTSAISVFENSWKFYKYDFIYLKKN